MWHPAIWSWAFTFLTDNYGTYYHEVKRDDSISRNKVKKVSSSVFFWFFIKDYILKKQWENSKYFEKQID